MSVAVPCVPGRRIDLGDLHLHAIDEAHGPPIVLLHGFTGSSENLEELARGLRDDGRRTVRLDLVGHGLSDAPEEIDRYRMEACVADVAHTLQILGLERVDLFGYSMGGRVALALALARPDLVRSVATVGATAGIADPAARAARIEADEKLADSILRDGIGTFVEHWMAQPLFATQRRVPQAVLDRERALRLGNRPHGLALSLRGMGSGAQPPLHDALASLRAPALLVAGAEDPKFVAIARDLANRIPLARVRVVASAGHAVQLEQPDALSRLLRSFLENPHPYGEDHES